MWICPKCNRQFRSINQSHSCVQTSIEDLFITKPDVVKLVYNKLHEKCMAFGKFSIDTTKSCIYFMEPERFLVIKPQNNGLILEFVLNTKNDVFPVIKVFDLGKGRFAHRLKLDEPDDVNAQIINWIKDALLLIRQKGKS